MENPKWTPNAEYEKKLTIKEIKFIFEQAEKRLIQSLEVSNIIVNRTQIILSASSTILLVVVGYLINTILDKSF